ncbi:MAG TPA: POTRA domain-containing protein, partial [Nevskiaceae bacterium]|nr:POTRA domain-containing protein [Nevskiaceae bacterium]
MHLGAAAALLLAAGNTLAQTPPGEPPPPARLPAAPPIEAPAPAPASAPAGAELQFQVSAFTFQGNTVFDSATLAPLVADFLNRPVSVADLNSAADRITAWYVHHGYTLALAMIPVQTINDGSVRIEVLEGRIAHLQADSHLYRPASVEHALQPLASGAIYRAPDMEAGLLRLNNRPGLHARALLRPGAEAGDTNILVQTQEQRFAALASVDDYGRDSLGRGRLTLDGEINNPFGLSDHAQLLALGSSTGGLYYGYAGYDSALGSDDWRGRVSYGEAHYKLSGVLDGINGKSRTGGAELDWTALRRRSGQLMLTLQASRVLSNTSFEDTPLPFDERYNLVQLGLQHLWAAPGGRWATQASMDIGSSLKQPDPASADSVRLRAELDAQVRYAFAARW